MPEGPRSSLGECHFFFFFLFLFSYKPSSCLKNKPSVLYISFNGPNRPKLDQRHNPRWRPSIRSRVRSLLGTIFFLCFSCFFPPTNLVLGERINLRYFLFSFNDEFPSQRVQHRPSKMAGESRESTGRFELPTRLTLPYNAFSNRRSRFTLWAHATRVALATAQAMCSYACVMRGTEIQSHKVDIHLSFTHIRSTPTSM